MSENSTYPVPAPSVFTAKQRTAYHKLSNEEKASRLKEARVSAGLSQKKLSAKMDEDPSVLASAESGEAELIPLYLSKVAEAIGRPLDEILGLPKAAPKRPRKPQPDRPVDPVSAENGARLKAARTKAGLSQVQLATRLGMTQGAIYQAETGYRNFSLKWLLKAAEAIGCRPSEISPLLADPEPAKKVKGK